MEPIDGTHCVLDPTDPSKEITMNLSNESNIADIAARHNELSGKGADPKSLAKRGKAKLLEQIAAMEADKTEAAIVELAGTPTPELSEKIEKAKEEPNGLAMLLTQMTNKASKPTKPKKEKAAKEKKEKGPVIRVVAEGLLLEVISKDEDGRPYGHSYETILDKIREQFDGAKTSVACLRWYAVHMRERGEKVPNRPRAQPKKEG